MRDKLINFFFDSEEEYQKYKPYITALAFGIFMIFVLIPVLLGFFI